MSTVQHLPVCCPLDAQCSAGLQAAVPCTRKEGPGGLVQARALHAFRQRHLVQCRRRRARCPWPAEIGARRVRLGGTGPGPAFPWDTGRREGSVPARGGFANEEGVEDAEDAVAGGVHLADSVGEAVRR